MDLFILIYLPFMVFMAVIISILSKDIKIQNRLLQKIAYYLENQKNNK